MNGEKIYPRSKGGGDKMSIEKCKYELDEWLKNLPP